MLTCPCRYTLLQAMSVAFGDMSACLPDANCRGGISSSINSSSGRTSSSSWHARAPVFHSFKLPAAIQLLQEVLDMYREEVRVKQQVILGLWGEHAASWLGISPGAQAAVRLRFSGSIPESVVWAFMEQLGDSLRGVGGRESEEEADMVRGLAEVAFSKGVKGSKGGDEDEELRQCLTVGITTWMVMPCVEEERVAAVLQLLTDDMTGF